MTQNITLNSTASKGSLAYYEGVMSNLPRLMVGKILLTQGYLAFHSYELRSGGLIGEPKLVPTGRVFGFELSKIIDVTVETNVRARRSRPNWKDRHDFEKKVDGEKSINARPRPLDASEKFKQLLVTYETENGLEVGMFELDDPELMLNSIRNYQAKRKSA